MIKFDLSVQQLEELEQLKPRKGYKVLLLMREQAADKIIRLQASAKTETVTTQNGTSTVAITELAETKMKHYAGILAGIDLILGEIESASSKIRKKQPKEPDD